MNSSQLFGITTLAYLLASMLYIAIFVFRAKKLGLAATSVTVAAFLIQTTAIGLRWYESYNLPGYGPEAGHAPLSNMYESLVFFSWCIAIFYLWLELKFKNRLIGAFAVPFAFLSMALASLTSDAIRPLVPALQSNWLIAHVITCFVGYAAFAVACGLGIMYLIREGSDTSNKNSLINTLPEPRIIDDITHKTMVFGFIWLSAGIITGAIWANSAWGTYWSWDPKETWSLITWFIYALALHARFVKGWGGKRIAWLAILGFISVVFTYYGVNYLLSGLHSYGS
ncbi:MAG: c-type cytochrome biogenesis protein CcsB [Proteobacteria bacterium]|nr:c-type cytochrome biogenesis protein CcsB [Pseudomonadota bacterium]MBU1710369.1 c-type cytochrome biogenesis protein CcsB [Pseudomonadota bacterium]